MASKVCALLAAVLLIQSASAQCLEYLQASAPVISSGPAYNIGGCGSNLLGSSIAANNAYALNGLANNAYAVNGLANNAYAVNGLNGLGLGLSNEALSVASGSINAPGSISILGENLAIGGTVSVIGSAPFAGTVGVAGAVPTSGQALVSYNSASGVGLTSGGCGQGVSSGVPLVYQDVGLGGLNNVGLASGGLGGQYGVGLGNNVVLGGLNNVGVVGLGNNLLGANIGVSSCGNLY